MGLPRLTRRGVVLLFALITDLFVIATWATRPAPLYFGRMGFGLGFFGDPDYPPVDAIRSWLNDELTPSPSTPTGFLTILAPEDLLILAALLFALVFLATALAMTESRRRHEGAAANRPAWPRVARFRVRTALVAIALVALYLGWELESWRRWESRRRYVITARSHASQEATCTNTLEQLRAELARLDAPSDGRPADTKTREARAADEEATRDRLRPQIAYHQALVAAYARLKTKYKDAADHPRRPVDPDPPLPKAPDLWPFATDWREPARALAAYTEQVRLYPALVEAHERRAWILATCDDARLRDGQAAVASATRACELTNWKDLNALKTLAAAYAEAGDFQRAVQWQQTVLERYTTVKLQNRFGQEILQWLEECLVLYKTTNPYHGKRSYFLLLNY